MKSVIIHNKLKYQQGNIIFVIGGNSHFQFSYYRKILISHAEVNEKFRNRYRELRTIFNIRIRITHIPTRSALLKYLTEFRISESDVV
jgi:hypothetical protein